MTANKDPLPCTDKVRILINMSLSFHKLHKLLLALIMIGLPLQGTLAAVMPLCAQAMQARDIRAGLEALAHFSSPTACGQHDIDNHPQPVADNGNMNDATSALSCDGVVCHIGSGLPPAASALNLTGGFSYAAPFNSRFTSSILAQPQHPPLI